MPRIVQGLNRCSNVLRCKNVAGVYRDASLIRRIQGVREPDRRHHRPVILLLGRPNERQRPQNYQDQLTSHPHITLRVSCRRHFKSLDEMNRYRLKKVAVLREISQALVIRPERMQLVQTLRLLGVFPTRTLTRWRFGFHRRFVRLLAWLTRCPYIGPLLHMSQRAMKAISFKKSAESITELFVMVVFPPSRGRRIAASRRILRPGSLAV